MTLFCLYLQCFCRTFRRVTIIGMDFSHCVIIPLSSGDNTEFLSTGAYSLWWFYMYGLPRQRWHLADFPGGTWGPPCLAMTQKWKTGDVYLVNNKPRAGFTPDLCTLLSHSPPAPPLLSRCVGYVTALSYLFQIRPSVSALIARRWAVDYFIFHSRVLQIKLSPLFHLQTDACYASSNTDFKELIG